VAKCAGAQTPERAQVCWSAAGLQLEVGALPQFPNWMDSDSAMSTEQQLPTKAPTDIAGVDEIIGGGFPLGRPTLLVGEPGSRGDSGAELNTP
jgi:hypothetical protein